MCARTQRYRRPSSSTRLASVSRVLLILDRFPLTEGRGGAHDLPPLVDTITINKTALRQRTRNQQARPPLVALQDELDGKCPSLPHSVPRGLSDDEREQAKAKLGVSEPFSTQN